MSFLFVIMVTGFFFFHIILFLSSILRCVFFVVTEPVGLLINLNVKQEICFFNFCFYLLHWQGFYRPWMTSPTPLFLQSPTVWHHDPLVVPELVSFQAPPFPCSITSLWWKLVLPSLMLLHYLSHSEDWGQCQARCLLSVPTVSLADRTVCSINITTVLLISFLFGSPSRPFPLHFTLCSDWCTDTHFPHCANNQSVPALVPVLETYL